MRDMWGSDYHNGKSCLKVLLFKRKQRSRIGSGEQCTHHHWTTHTRMHGDDPSEVRVCRLTSWQMAELTARCVRWGGALNTTSTNRIEAVQLSANQTLNTHFRAARCGGANCEELWFEIRDIWNTETSVFCDAALKLYKMWKALFKKIWIELKWDLKKKSQVSCACL